MAEKNKNIEPELNFTGSYLKKRVYAIPSTTPPLRYIYFEIALLATSNIGSSNENGTFSRFA